jgi:hypothetical protein
VIYERNKLKESRIKGTSNTTKIIKNRRPPSVLDDDREQDQSMVFIKDERMIYF